MFPSLAKDIDFSAFLKLDGNTLREVLSFNRYLNFKDTFLEKRKTLEDTTLIDEPPAKRTRLDISPVILFRRVVASLVLIYLTYCLLSLLYFVQLIMASVSLFPNT